MSKIDLQLNFDEIIKRIELDKDPYKPSEWADKVGVAKNIISNVHGKIKQKPSLEYIVAVSKATGKPVDYYLWGKEFNKPQSIENDSDNLTKLIIEHQDLLKRFKNQKRAKEINERLIDIEDASDELYDKADTYLQGLHDAATVIKGSKKTPKDGEDIQDKSTA